MMKDQVRRLKVLSSQLTDLRDQNSSFTASDTSSNAAEVIILSPEVERAVKLRQPVVALESTIISHGMPYPQNLRTALEVEEVIRANGATPATIAILKGIPHVGLTLPQLEHIAKAGHEIRKVSRRDLPYIMSCQLDGATTVSATMLLAARAGIDVFVTGGIGGVHRDGERTLDISADLTELGKTPVAVICAGAKSILDIPRTLEYLETQGVLVAAYRTTTFPAFFTPDSGCTAPCRFDSPEEVARAIVASKKLQLSSGLIVGVPIPQEASAVGEEVEKATVRALQEAKAAEVQGNAVTPFLLRRITELTGGKSLEANIALVKNNARLGALIAVALTTLG